MKKKEVILIIHNVRSAYNVGSIFRTAETAGINEIYLTGYTPAPVDKFGRGRKDIAKVSLGAEKIIPWKKFSKIREVLIKFKKENYFIVAIEQSKNSFDYKKVKPRQKTVFIVGNEIKGLDQKILNKCEVIAEIPMKGKKESLNVAVSVGIALFRILKI